MLLVVGVTQICTGDDVAQSTRTDTYVLVKRGDYEYTLWIFPILTSWF